MAPQEFKDLLDRYSRGECTPDEENLISEWYENIGQNQANEVREEFRIVLESKIWSRLQNRLGEPDSSRFAYWQKIAAAVAIFLLVGAGTFIVATNFSSDSVQQLAEQVNPATSVDMLRVENTDAFPKTVKLHDGSQVTLEPSSEIQFPKAFGSNREVYLKGEAFFNVTRDPEHPFLVYSNEVITRVLGTSFTIKAYDEAKKITVAVKSGRVSVYKNSVQAQHGEYEKDEIILAPNQQAVYDRARHEVSRQLVDKPLIVHQPANQMEMKYDGAQVVKIFGALEEIYGVEIEYDAEVLGNCTITTSMKEEGLFERIKVICEAIGAQYEVLGTSILIKSEGCN